MRQLAGAQTLERGLDCLFALAKSNLPLSVSELAAIVNLPESTVYRCCGVGGARPGGANRNRVSVS